MTVMSVLEPDKNFALEKYGEESRCFDHTNDMWEERSCRQVRQWQHWGSGCYHYTCEDGRLHIMVANYTYTCFHAGQEVTIRIISNGWLRKGAIRCPPCKELCQEKFAAIGQTCRNGEEPQPANLYPRDELVCKASSRSFDFTMLLLPVWLFRLAEIYMFTWMFHLIVFYYRC